MATFQISPDPPSFGYVGSGFLYQLKVSLTNISNIMTRYKVTIDLNDPQDPNTITSDYKVANLAPGMTISFLLTLSAVSSYETTYTMMITPSCGRASGTKEGKGVETAGISQIKIISALIISLDVFKKIAKSLLLRDRNIYLNGVRCVGQLNGDNVGISIISGAPTIYSEALIDDDELDELMDLPILPETYWNPYTKELCVDQVLGQVITSPKWTIEESRHATEESWSARVEELESQGMLTSRILERLINEKINRSTSFYRSYSSFDQQTLSYPSLQSPSILSPEKPEI